MPSLRRYQGESGPGLRSQLHRASGAQESHWVVDAAALLRGMRHRMAAHREHGHWIGSLGAADLALHYAASRANFRRPICVPFQARSARPGVRKNRPPEQQASRNHRPSFEIEQGASCLISSLGWLPHLAQGIIARVMASSFPCDRQG
ncbi:hypothetical protein CBM2618_A80082 [Cupriavidus taiwanensis]|nr:hypothetical protein CBM2618_A80082 [Cupriavidus taiwanensis]